MDGIKTSRDARTAAADPRTARSHSIAPSETRREVQHVCIESWKRLGLAVVAVQHADEIEALRPHFPGVEFVLAKRRHSSKPNVLINDLADVIRSRDVPGILINADIEIRATQKAFLAAWTPRRRTITVGVRHNYGDDGAGSVETAGLDVFLLTPEMVRSLPEIEFAIGVPFWDYWLPHHFRSRGCAVNVIDAPMFWHRKHELQWSSEDWRHNRDLLKQGYGLNDFEIQYFRDMLQEPSDRRKVVGKSTTAIFIKTCPKDHDWLEHCLRSIQRYARKFTEVVIVDDESGRSEIEGWNLTQELVHFVDDPAPKYGYIQQQIVKLQADRFTDCDQILFLDSDCIFTRPCTPADFFRDGKPLWMRGRYGTVEGAQNWKAITESVLGGEVEWEYMRRQPFVIHRETLQAFRAAYPAVIPSLRGRTGTNWSEFNVLGEFAARTHPERYTFIDHEDEDPPRFVQQFWSWGGITSEIHSQIHGALA